MATSRFARVFGRRETFQLKPTVRGSATATCPRRCSVGSSASRRSTTPRSTSAPGKGGGSGRHRRRLSIADATEGGHVHADRPGLRRPVASSAGTTRCPRQGTVIGLAAPSVQQELDVAVPAERERAARSSATGRGRGPVLFVYGTLRPGDVRWPFLEPFVADDGIDDTVAVPCSTPVSAIPPRCSTRAPRTTIAGPHVRAAFRSGSTRHSRCSTRRRTPCRAVPSGGGHDRAGRQAWAYAYGDGLDLTPIPSGDWFAR